METKSNLILIGGGGHCKSVLDTAIRMDRFSEIVITDNKVPAGTKIMGHTIVGNDGLLPKLFQEKGKEAFISIGSIKSTKGRIDVFKMAKEIGFDFPVIIDPSAEVAESVKLGAGIFIGKNAIINACTQIGDMAIINTGAIIEHGCSVGKYVHVAPGAVLCGDVKIGQNAFIGSNATVIQGVTIGMNCVVGAGSIVLCDVPKNSTVVGIVRRKK